MDSRKKISQARTKTKEQLTLDQLAGLFSAAHTQFSSVNI